MAGAEGDALAETKEGRRREYKKGRVRGLHSSASMDDLDSF